MWNTIDWMKKGTHTHPQTSHSHFSQSIQLTSSLTRSQPQSCRPYRFKPKAQILSAGLLGPDRGLSPVAVACSLGFISDDGCWLLVACRKARKWQMDAAGVVGQSGGYIYTALVSFADSKDGRWERKAQRKASYQIYYWCLGINSIMLTTQYSVAMKSSNPNYAFTISQLTSRIETSSPAFSS